MIRKSIWGALLVLILPWGATAAELPVGSGLVLELEVPQGWELSREAPAFLVEEMAEHLGHELAEEGKSPSPEQLLEAARQRLAANEGFLFNPATGAHLLIDFSPLREGEDAPGARGVALSARYAGEGMNEEEGVSDVTFSTEPAAVAGAAHAHGLSVDYRHHDEPRRFLGIVGFAQPAWFYLYYTDPLRSGEDLPAMKRVLDGLELEKTGE